jgi:chitinase
VTTVTIPLSTTVCPITHTTPVPTSHPAGMTTSTVYTTKTSTITSCAAYVTDCSLGSVTTVTIPLYTTVYPIATESPYPTESSVTVSLPSFSLPSSIAEGTSSAEGEEKTTSTRFSTLTSYTTIQFVHSTVTVAPVPVYPTQVKQVSSSPSGFTYTAVPTGGASGEVTSSPYPTGPAEFTGAGVKISGSVGMIVAMFVAAMVL